MRVNFNHVVILFVCTTLSFSCSDRQTLFTSLSPSATGIDFVNTPDKESGLDIFKYLYYYNGAGVSIGDINNDSLPDIYFASNTKGKNRLYLNKGNFQFEDITAKAGVTGTTDWCTGVTMADLNGDGLLDIYVCSVVNHHGLKGHNQLFINNGNNTFTESAAAYGLDFSGYSTQAAFFDFDHDGDLDCYLLNQSQRPNTEVVDTSNRRRPDLNAGDRLYRNDMNGTAKKFTDISQQAGIYQSDLGFGLGISVADLNNDGWDDIYVGNDFNENDYYYVNNGNGTFTESGAGHFGHYSYFSMGNDIADYNNDGLPDVVTLDMLPQDEKVLKSYGSDLDPNIYQYKILNSGYQHQYSKNCLHRNNNNGSSFSETALLSGVAATDWSWSPLLADFDNDGNKDLFVSGGIPERPVDLDFIQYQSNPNLKKDDGAHTFDEKGNLKMPEGSSHPYFFRGNGSLSFNDVSAEWGTGTMSGYFNGAAYADLDNDGRLDLVINALNAPALVLRNNSAEKNFISISFKGEGMNTYGIGCKAYVFQESRMQFQELMFTRGFQSSSDTRLHFGLDTLSAIDSILVVWPDQRYEIKKNIAGGRQLQFNQQEATGAFKYEEQFKPSPGEFSSLKDSVTIPWRHKENSFTDFNVQYLIPHGESTRGPKIAVGDVNGDGLDDFYACGPRDQPGVLMIQQKTGAFISADADLFSKDAGCEDVDAVFFDADGNGSMDLYVVSVAMNLPEILKHCWTGYM